jgi:DNA-binding NarL/FixJ family response regulator
VTRVLISADSVVVRAGLEALLTGNPELNVVGHAPDLAKLIEQAEHLRTDVLLAEFEIRDDEAATTLTVLAADPLAPAIVLLADYPSHAKAVELLRSGVRGCCPAT